MDGLGGGVLLSHLPSPAPRVPPSTCPVASHHSIWAVLFVGKGCGHGGAGEGAASVAKKLIDTKGRHRLSFEQCFIICLVFSIQKNPSLFLFYSDSKKKKMLSEYFGFLSSLMQSVYKSLY